MSTCLVCGTAGVETVLEAGEHPISSRYLRSANEPEVHITLTLGVCPTCGVAQLIEPPDASLLVPVYDWIRYNEPEKHLDDMAAQISALPGITAESAIWGVSYKEDSTLARLNALGFSNTFRMDTQTDLDITVERPGMESIQAAISADAPDRIVQAHGLADVIIVRHMLEHAHNQAAFIAGLRRMLAPGGYLTFEVPDAALAFETLDYASLWEDHIVYFTEATFRSCLAANGLEVKQFLRYEYPFENSLVALAGATEKAAVRPLPPDVLADQLALARRYGESFPAVRDQVRAFFAGHHASGDRIALFGAGHLACMYINIMGVRESIKVVLDDDPNKAGKYLPGSRLPILPSGALYDREIGLCLLSLFPQTEIKIIDRHAAFIEAGGRFLSIFPSSSRALPLDPPQKG